MNTEKLMYALGNINDEYIYEATKRTKKHTQILKRVAVIVAILLTVIFFQTEIGVKAVEYIKNTTTELFEMLFPDKNVTVSYEGTTEYISHIAGGEIPDKHENSPGFSIYYDNTRYEMIKEDDIYYIRAKHIPTSREEIIKYNSTLLEGLDDREKEAEIQRLIDEQEKFYSSLPVCEIEIVRINETSPENAADMHRKNLQDEFAVITENETCDNHNGVYFFVSEGDNWNSVQGYIYFIDDKNGGAFRLTARFFGEAAEGHGNRFRTMIETFKVIS